MNPSSPLPELPAIGFLSHLDGPYREFLASFGKFVRPQSAEVLITEGKPQDSLYLVLAGMLHVVTGAGDRPTLVASLGSGDSIGEVNVFDPASASASVIARSECLIWKITGEELEGFFSADPVAGIGFMKGLMRLEGQRIRAMNAKLSGSEEKAAFHNFWKLGQ